jgi:putative aldouronate transport system substrate-binding protein
MKKRRVIGLLLGAAVFALFTGCGGRNKTAAAGKTTAGTKEPITFTFYNGARTSDLPFTDPVAQKIKEATGVTLDISYPVGGAGANTVSLMLASGDLPDFIYSQGSLPTFYEADVVLQLDELIDQYGPNIKKLYGKYFSRLRYTTADPHIYQLPAYDTNIAYWEADGIMQIQHAVLKELGYPKMETLEDLERAIREYARRHPTIDGQPTIPLGIIFSNYSWLFDIGNTAGFAAGWQDDGEYIVDDETLETTYKWIHPGMKPFVRWVNKMYHEGLMDREAFTQSNDEFLAKIASGRTLAIALPRWYYLSALSSLLADGKPERTYAYMPITNDETVESRLLRDYGYGAGWGIMITKNCKDPERLIEFFDYMCSEEAQILTNWGIEGENYDIIDGKRVLQADDREGMRNDPDYTKKTGVPLAGDEASTAWTYPFPQYGRGYIDSTGNYMTPLSPQTIIDSYNATERETLAAYGKETWIDFFPPTDTWPPHRHGRAFEYNLPTEDNVIFIQCYETISAHLGKIIMAPPADFDRMWQAMVDELIDIGAERIGAKMTELIRDKVSLWEMPD